MVAYSEVTEGDILRLTKEHQGYAKAGDFVRVVSMWPGGMTVEDRDGKQADLTSRHSECRVADATGWNSTSPAAPRNRNPVVEEGLLLLRAATKVRGVVWSETLDVFIGEMVAEMMLVLSGEHHVDRLAELVGRWTEKSKAAESQVPPGSVIKKAADEGLEGGPK